MASLSRRKRAGLVGAELTPDMHEALVEARRGRLFFTQVCIRCGVDAKTVKRWLTMGVQEGAQEPYLSFAREFAEAEIQAEDDALEVIARGQDAKGGCDWKAVAWWLERWKPTRWGARVPEAGPREDVDMQQLIEDSERRSETLVELLADPPPELEKAMRQNREAILAMLAQDTPELPEG